MLLYKLNKNKTISKLYGDPLNARSASVDEMVVLTPFNSNITCKIKYFDPVKDEVIGVYNALNIASNKVYVKNVNSSIVEEGIAFIHKIPNDILLAGGTLRFSLMFMSADGKSLTTGILSEEIRNSTWEVKPDPNPNPDLDPRFWPIASENQLGVVKVDGQTISADEFGVLSAIVDENSVIFFNTPDEPTDELKTIKRGEHVYEVVASKVKGNTDKPATENLTNIDIDGKIYSVQGNIEFAEGVDVSGKWLDTIKANGGTWRLDNVEANVEQAPTVKLDNLRIKDTTYELPNDTIEFSDEAADGLKLRSIKVKDDVWSVDPDLSEYAKKTDLPNKTSQLTNDSGFTTDAKVDKKIADLIDTAPETLNTLDELAKALGDDPNFATTMTTELGKKADKTDVDAKFSQQTIQLALFNTELKKKPTKEYVDEEVAKKSGVKVADTFQPEVSFTTDPQTQLNNKAEKIATAATYGGVKAAPKTEAETAEVKIGPDGKLYSQAGGKVDLSEYYKSTQVDELLGKKLDKVAEQEKVYATDGLGNQTTLQYNVDPIGDGLVKRTSDGRVKAAAPTESNDVATKEYVDAIPAGLKVYPTTIKITDPLVEEDLSSQLAGKSFTEIAECDVLKGQRKMPVIGTGIIIKPIIDWILYKVNTEEHGTFIKLVFSTADGSFTIEITSKDQNKTIIGSAKHTALKAIPTKTSQLTNDSGFVNESAVDSKISALVDSSPETLNTLNELAAALGDDPNFAATTAEQIGKKQDKLVSGVNIKTLDNQPILGEGNIDVKTINNESILGSGNLEIKGSKVIELIKESETDEYTFTIPQSQYDEILKDETAILSISNVKYGTQESGKAFVRRVATTIDSTGKIVKMFFSSVLADKDVAFNLIISDDRTVHFGLHSMTYINKDINVDIEMTQDGEFPALTTSQCQKIKDAIYLNKQSFLRIRVKYFIFGIPLWMIFKFDGYIQTSDMYNATFATSIQTENADWLSPARDVSLYTNNILVDLNTGETSHTSMSIEKVIANPYDASGYQNGGDLKTLIVGDHLYSVGGKAIKTITLTDVAADENGVYRTTFLSQLHYNNVQDEAEFVKYDYKFDVTTTDNKHYVEVVPFNMESPSWVFNGNSEHFSATVKAGPGIYDDKDAMLTILPDGLSTLMDGSRVPTEGIGGLVKAAPRTDEDTQEVKIDKTTGKLFTKAGSDGEVKPAVISTDEILSSSSWGPDKTLDCLYHDTNRETLGWFEENLNNKLSFTSGNTLKPGSNPFTGRFFDKSLYDGDFVYAISLNDVSNGFIISKINAKAKERVDYQNFNYPSGVKAETPFGLFRKGNLFYVFTRTGSKVYLFECNWDTGSIEKKYQHNQNIDTVELSSIVMYKDRFYFTAGFKYEDTVKYIDMKTWGIVDTGKPCLPKDRNNYYHVGNLAFAAGTGERSSDFSPVTSSLNLDTLELIAVDNEHQLKSENIRYGYILYSPKGDVYFVGGYYISSYGGGKESPYVYELTHNLIWKELGYLSGVTLPLLDYLNTYNFMYLLPDKKGIYIETDSATKVGELPFVWEHKYFYIAGATEG